MAGRPSAAARSGGANEVITIDTHELRALVQRLKQVEDRKIKAALRKTLKQAGDLAVDGVRETVQDGVPAKTGLVRYKRKRTVSSKGNVRFRKVVADVGVTEGGRTRSTGLRADIARSVRASLTAGSDKRGGQVKIVADDKRLQPRHRNMVKGYNAKTFRHPIFGSQSQTRDQWKWAYQRGQGNYFGRGVYGKRDEMQRRLAAAMKEVADYLDGK